MMPIVARIVSPELIGRDAELAAISAALDEADQGRGRTILIGGEAGVGKSRLLAESLELMRPRAAVVLAGGCIPIGETALPFAPVAEAVRPLAREWRSLAERGPGSGQVGHSATSTAVRPAIPGVVAELGLLGSEAAAPPISDVRPEWARSRIYEAFLDLLRGFAADRPVVLAIEDLHWADASTRELLSFLVRNERSERLLVIATFRTDELQPRHPLLSWLGEIDRLAHVERIELRPLYRAEIARLIGAILCRTPDPELVARVHARAEGNPFFVEVLLASGVETEQLPPTLREVLAARLARASAPTMRVLGVAAVIGRRVDHELLANLSGLSEGALEDALQEAVGAGLLVVDEDGSAERYLFRHALLAEAAADAVLPARRRHLHAAIAEALVASPPLRGADEAGRLGEIALHWFSAHDPCRALPAAVEAAAAAMRTAAFVEAHRHYERAVQLWDSVDSPEELVGFDRVELLRRSSQAAQLAGAFDAATARLREAIERLEQTGSDPPREGLLYERLGRALYAHGAFNDSLGAYEKALERVPAQPPSVDRARVVAGYAQALVLVGRETDGLAAAEPALAIARAAGSRQLEGHLMATIGTALSVGNERERAVELLRDALDIAREVDDIDDLFRAYGNLSATLVLFGRYAEAAEVGLEGVSAARQRGMTSTWGSNACSNAAFALIVLGRWDEALRLIRELEAGAVGFAWMNVQKDLAPLLTMRGEFEEASIRLDELEERLGGETEPQWLGPAAKARVDLSMETGDVARGRAVVDHALPFLATGEDTFFYAEFLSSALKLEAAAAERARAARDRPALDESVRRSDDLLEAMLRLCGSPAAAGKWYLRRALALGQAEMSRIRGEPDPDAWRDVLAADTETASVHEIAYARFRLAEALLETTRERGTANDARDVLVEAHSTAAALGARPLLSAIEELAARARLSLEVSPAGDNRDGRATTQPARGPASKALDSYGLTEREVEVLRLLARGRTNRQIGKELFISESTAAVHVAHIIAKLGVRGRVEAATIAAHLGVVGLGAS